MFMKTKEIAIPENFLAGNLNGKAPNARVARMFMKTKEKFLTD